MYLTRGELGLVSIPMQSIDKTKKEMVLFERGDFIDA